MNLKKIMKLDLLVIRPYLTPKNLVIYLGLVLLYAVFSKSGFVAIIVGGMVALIFSGYPFMVGEQAGIDPLYRLFAIPNKDVVKGRYAVMMLTTALLLLVGTGIYALLSLFFPEEDLIKGMLISGPSMFFVISFLIFLEYPIYFKLGYFKGKTLASIPYYFVCGGIFILTPNLEQTVRFLTVNAPLVIASLSALWLVALFVSYRLSVKLYSQRDF